MKKFWSILVVVLLVTVLAVAFSATASAEDAYSWSYDEETKTLTIGPDSTGWIGTASTTNTYRYPWEASVTVSEVEHLVVEEGTVYLGKFVFGRMKTNLVDVKLPSTLLRVYSYNFYACSNLQSITYAGSPAMLANVVVDDVGNTKYDSALVNATGLSGSCGAAEADVNYFLNKETGLLTFTGTGAMTEGYAQRGTPWYDSASYVTKVVVGSGVTSIGKWSLAYLSNMTEIVVPFTLKSVGAYAFANTSSLSTVTYEGSPATFEKISVYNHTYNNSFKNAAKSYGAENTIGGTIAGSELTWSADFTTGVLTVSGTGAIPDFARKADAPWFNCADFITSLYIGDGVTRLGVRSFTALRNITSVSIPASLTEVANISFGNATLLKNVEYRGTVVGLGGLNIVPSYNTYFIDAKYTCTEAGETVATGSVSGITWTFDSSTGTLTISGKGAMPAYGEKSSVPWYAYRQFITDIVVEEGVTVIGKWCFGALKEVTSLTVPCTMTSVDAYAFANASKLATYNYTGSSATYKVSISSIYNTTLAGLTPSYGTDDLYSAALDDTGLTWTIDFATGTLTVGGNGAVGDYAKKTATPWHPFYSSVKNLVIESGVTSVGKWSFGSLTALKTLELPASLTNIGERAFANSRGLNSIVFNGTKKQFEAMTVSESYNAPFFAVVPTFTVEEEVKTTYTLKEDGTYELTTYAIADGTDVVIPLVYDGKVVTSIANGVFKDMAITSVKIPCSVETIGASAFEGCTALVSVTVLSGTPEIPADIFDAIIEAGESTEMGSDGLIALATSDNLATIGDRAFYGCSALATLVLPDKEIKVGADAFTGTAFAE